jgi:8-oxo-dGTP pyrophosphatase MutT (NUDIX family)
LAHPLPETVRPAASLVLWRDGAQGAAVLMGQRGAGAAFMPSKYVFPGGAVDPGDRLDPPLPLHANCLSRLAQGPVPPGAVVAAALRELTEETGLALRPDAPLRFVFRAVTPPGRSRRFDASFLLAEARDLTTNPDDLGAAGGELAHLAWLPLPQARALDLPFITEIVLAEVAHLIGGGQQPGVPFFDNLGSVPAFRRLT